MTVPSGPSEQRRFLIIGLPRSGTTYLMTLLNAHPDILCAGEQFNPYMILDAEAERTDYVTLLQRDRAPRYFSEAFFETHADQPYTCVGYKYMLGHNIRVITALPDWQDLTLIYVHRRNKLAQVSSLIKADTTQRWAQEHKSGHINRKIEVGPLRISQYWHELDTWDFLFGQWFDQLANPKLKLEYCELFQDGFNARICDFLQVPQDPDMKSTLVKQGVNTILDRFSDPGPIREYFTEIGRDNWLGREI